ncbi:MAG TPA: DUF2497 domain-containing protein [Pseudolabrys sp.]|jgi:cell pole-organizing protein PopZ|nr:DUF2497 domain-containing protein [Pseudolabrys sp.]
MSKPAKAEEPSMEEILASIRRIIADDDASKASKPPEPDNRLQAVSPRPEPVPSPPPEAAHNQDDIDAMLADLEPPAAEAAKDQPAAEPDVFDLTESMTAKHPAANFRTIDGQSDVVFADSSGTEPVAPEAESRRAPPPTSTDSMLLSSSTRAAVDTAFSSLAHTVLAQNARTLDDIVKELLRPMLKSWLDDNLPGLVERIVRAEIERVSRGRP